MPYQEFIDSERNGWNERAEGYDRATALGTTQIVPGLLMPARVHSGARLLDVACGPGYAAGAASRMGLFVRTIGMARARTTIGMANLAYNLTRFVWHQGRTAPA